MFGGKCSSPGYGFVSGIFSFFFFFAALSATLHCGKTLGPEKSFEYGKIFQEYGWETRTFEEGKKKAPLIQGRRVETGTYHWEGRKPFIQTFDFTLTLLHTDMFTHRHFYTQTFLQTGAAFTHKRFDAQKLLHIDAFTHRHFYTQTRTAQVKSHFCLSFCRSTLISRERVAPGQVKSQFYRSVFADRPSFRAKGLLRHK